MPCNEASSVSEYQINYCPSYEEWNSFLEEHDRDNLQQSFEFGEVSKSLYPNPIILRLLLKKHEKSVGLVQGSYNQGRIIGGPLSVEGFHGTGPVVEEGQNKKRVFSMLISFLEKCAIKNKVPHGFIVHQSGMGDVLRILGYNLFYSHNVYRFYLNNDVSKAWQRIDHNKRRNIKKAISQGVEVTSGVSKENLVSFYEMLSLSSVRVGFEIRPFNYYKEILKVFGKIGKAKIFTAYLRDRPVAGLFVVDQGHAAHALSAGSRPEAWRARPNDLLHWKAIELSCKEGLLCYNFGAVPDPPGGSLWRWKNEWNGQLEKMPICHKVYMPKLETLFCVPYGKIIKRLTKKS
jgi:hypothetical protein